MRGLLQHWTESSIILTSKEGSVWRNKKRSKRGPFPSWKTDRWPDLRVLPGHWSQWFCWELCRPIYNCSTKWWYSGIQFKVGRNSIIYDENPTWWHLGRIVQLRKRESEKLKTVLALYDLEIHQKKTGPDNHRLKTMVKKQYRARIYELKNLRPETEIMKGTP